MTEKRVPCRSMFSNGTEYELFLEEQCFRCTRFRNWHCRIVNACEKARFLGEKVFPFDDLLEWEHYGGKTCKHFTTDAVVRKRKPRQPERNQVTLWEEKSNG